MDVQEAQESEPKVMETIGQNCEVHKVSRDLATFMPKAGKPDIIEAFLDGDWACDDL